MLLLLRTTQVRGTVTNSRAADDYHTLCQENFPFRIYQLCPSLPCLVSIAGPVRSLKVLRYYAKQLNKIPGLAGILACPRLLVQTSVQCR